MKKCLLDMDGVLVNFVKGSLDIHNISTSVDEMYANHPGEWDFVKILGMSPPAFWKPMDEEFWAKLEWMPDGQDILRMVEQRFGQENVVIVTSPSSNYGCHAGKLRWMERHLPRHYSKSKGHMFGSLKWLMSNPNHILVDDHNENVDAFASYNGGQICHVPRIWNRLHEQRHRTREFVAERLGL